MSSVLATASTIFAPGAIPCAYSTSSDVSIAHVMKSLEPASVTCVCWFTIVKLGGSGKPFSASNCARSCWMNGEPYAVTIRIVWPAPVGAFLPVGKS